MTLKTTNGRVLNVAGLLDDAVDGWVPVHWRLDKADRQGLIHVFVPAQYSDRKVIAELCALRHLMSAGRPVYGASRAPSSALTTVTSGAIRKAFRQETEKGEIIPFARFLFFSFSESSLEVDKDISWAKELPVVEEFRLEASHSPWEMAPLTAANGFVAITRHAVERYQERVGTKTLANTLNGLKKALLDVRTEPLAVSEAKRISGLAKYGKEARFFMHRLTKLIFVVLQEDGMLKLSTVYHEPAPLKEAVYAGGRVEYRNRA